MSVYWDTTYCSNSFRNPDMQRQMTLEHYTIILLESVQFKSFSCFDCAVTSQRGVHHAGVDDQVCHVSMTSANEIQ